VDEVPVFVGYFYKADCFLASKSLIRLVSKVSSMSTGMVILVLSLHAGMEQIGIGDCCFVMRRCVKKRSNTPVRITVKQEICVLREYKKGL